MTDRENWTYINRKHYWWSLIFMIVLVTGTEIFVFIKFLQVISTGLQRNFSQPRDIAIPLVFLVQMIFVVSTFLWAWKMRYNTFNPSFRMNEEIMEIDRKNSVQFYWKDVNEIVITDIVEFVGLLYNFQRQAIIFKLPEGKQEFIVIGKGIYIDHFEKFLALLKEYVPEEKINYQDTSHLEKYIKWIKWR